MSEAIRTRTLQALRTAAQFDLPWESLARVMTATPDLLPRPERVAVLTGMSADGFRVQPVTGAARWTISQADDFSPITFTWSGTLASGGLSPAQNVSFNYVGSAPRPFGATFPCVPGDAAIATLILNVTAL
jgi:hypothetical protein